MNPRTTHTTTYFTCRWLVVVLAIFFFVDIHVLPARAQELPETTTETTQELDGQATTIEATQEQSGQVATTETTQESYNSQTITESGQVSTSVRIHISYSVSCSYPCLSTYSFQWHLSAIPLFSAATVQL